MKHSLKSWLQGPLANGYPAMGFKTANRTLHQTESDMKSPLLLLSFFVTILLTNCENTPADPTAEAPKKPNIVLIMADDLGYEGLSCYGSSWYETPELDKLAAGGMQFMNAYSTPLCTPTRVQIMTGKYNHRNYLGFGILRPGEQTFGLLLQKAGYRTAVVGKWQLWGNERQQELVNGRHGSLPQEAGFDEYCLWQIKERGYRYKSATLKASGQETAVFYPGQYGPDLFLDFINGFLERNQDQPFFLYYPMVLVHDPFQHTPDTEGYAEFDPDTRLNDTTYFKDEIAYMDKIVGSIADKLEELELRENTLFIFTGDNGTHRNVVSYIGDQKIPGSKGLPIEWGTHVPMIANWPGMIEPGQTNENLIDFTDFLPTLLETVDFEGRDTVTTDGISFYPQLTGGDYQPREWVYCYYHPNWGRFEHTRYAHDKEWKLFEDGRFYHFSEDPLEENPLEDGGLSAEALAAKDRLQGVLDRYAR